jgi:hypothetical protein
MKSLFRVLPVLLCVLSMTNAQPQLSVSIHVPTLTVNPNGEEYAPMPLPVQATIYNTGNVASAQLSARISFVADLALDPSENGAIIKVPLPSAVPANDSAKVEWLLYHPPAFATKNYRIRIWLLTSAVDSFETQKLFTLPAMAPPDFKFTLGPIPRLEVRADSLGYQVNPFTINLRLANQGGTTIDTVSVKLHLPEDYILEPTTQANPYNVPIPMPAPTAGNPRIDILWTLRYYGSTIVPRTDTLRIVAKGKDIAGNWREEDTLIILQVDGLSPAVETTLPGSNSLQYDAATIYTPKPYRFAARIENIGEQWAQLVSVKAMIEGEGVALLDAALRPAGPSLLPGTVIDFTWDISVERRATARQFTATVELTDLNGRKRAVTTAIQVPGKPYFLTVEGFTAPDTVAVNAEGTNFLSADIPLRYSIGNRTWYNSTVQQIRVQSQGTGIKAPPFHDYQPQVALAPDQVSAPFDDAFAVEGQVQGRLLNFHILAISDRGDTARGTRPVFVPGLRPVLSMHRWGTDELRYDRVNNYAPNPFYEEYVLRNEGYVAVRVDSLRLTYNADGVSTPEPPYLNIGLMLNPGDSVVTRWNFLAYKRDTDREINMSVSAWTSGEQHLTLDHTVRIPGLYPVPELTLSGDDTLAYDPVRVYSPNPFTKKLIVRNIGTDDLICDSIIISFSDARVTLLDAPAWNVGAMLEVDSTLEVTWQFAAQERDASLLLPITATLHHSRGVQQASGTVFIPALLPGLEVTFLGDSFLTMNTETVYAPDPFTKTVRVANNGTGTLRLDSIRLKSSDPDIRFVEERTQHVNGELQPGQASSVSWHGSSGPRYIQGNVLLEFDIHHSGGEVLPAGTSISIPGRAHSFEVTDIELPAQMVLGAGGYTYASEGFALRFRALNDCWAKSLFTRAVVEVNTDDGLTRVGPGGDFLPNEVLDANAVSGVLVDSFLIAPRTVERFLSLEITVYDGFMRSGSANASIYVPAVIATSVNNIHPADDFRIASVYPMPAKAGKDASVTVSMEGLRGGEVALELYDMLGRRVTGMQSTYESSRTFSLRLPLGNATGGTYILRAMSGGRQQSRLLQIR